MEFRVLGPIEVIENGVAKPLGGLKQRLVLALLLQRANQPVTASELVDAIWGAEPPETARNSLQSYVSHVRKAMGGRITSGPSGYTLNAASTEIDAECFRVLFERGSAELANDPATAAITLAEALALWRGPALADLATEDGLRGAIARLEEMRLLATERRMDAELDTGRHAALIGELESLTEQHGMRERIWAQLMVALYRSGRQGEALRAYERARTLLLEELGIDPSVELQTLYQRILVQDDDLLLTPNAVASPTPSPTTPPLAAQPIADPQRTRRRRWLVPVVLVVALVSAVIVTVNLRSDEDDSPKFNSYGPGIAIIDASSGESLSFVSPEVVRAPVESIFANGAFWVLNLEPLSFASIDPATGEVLRQIASPIDDVGSFAVDGNDLWITHYTLPVLSKVDIALGLEVQRIENLPGDGGNYGVVVADGSVWVARRDAAEGLGALARLDPATGAVQDVIEPLLGSYSLVYGDDGAIWTAGTSGVVNRVDPRTNDVTSTDVGARNFYVAYGGGFGWTSDEAGGRVFKIDRSGEIVATYQTGSGARVVSFNEGRLWVGNQDAGTVTSIDAESGALSTYLFDHPVLSIAAGAGRVLVQLDEGPTFEGRLAALDGLVAKFFVDQYLLDPLDTALLNSALGAQVEGATCAGLMRATGSSAGAVAVEPEIAAGPPLVSADGLTYAFTIRDGFRFSPPSNEEVTAETIRFSIERALSPRFGDFAPAADLLDDVVGVDAYRNGSSDHITGLAVDGDTLTITLVAPSDTLIERLSSSSLCPVPLGTPTIANIGGARLPTGEGSTEYTLPAAGPYYIAGHSPGEYTILLRNPNYSGSRPHVFDAIVLREGISPEQAADLVEAGEWDGVLVSDDGSGAAEDLVGATIGCREFPNGRGIDLAAMCPAD